MMRLCCGSISSSSFNASSSAMRRSSFFLRAEVGLVKGNRFTRRTFGSRSTARIVDQNPPHCLRGNAKKVTPVLPVDRLLVDQLQVSLMNQRGSLQCVLGVFAPQIKVGQPPQFIIDNR